MREDMKFFFGFVFGVFVGLNGFGDNVEFIDFWLFMESEKNRDER